MSPSRIRRSAIASASLVTAAVLLSSCSSTEPTAQPTTSASPEAGGAISIGVSADPVCLDPQQNGNAASINISRQVVDSLVDLDPDTGEVVPWLAESWTASEDATSFEFVLREGVTFSDGTPLTAQIVADNLDTVVTLGAATSLVTGYLSGYEGSTALDERTVRVEFSKPSAGFLPTAAVVQLGIVAPATLALSAEERCAAENIVGTGPFVYETYTQNESTTLVRRDGYDWTTARAAHEGDAYLESVTYQVIGEASVRVGSLQSQQLTAITDVQPSDEETLTASGFAVISRANPGVVNTLYPRATNPLTADEAVRTAVQLGIDRAELASVLSESYAAASGVLATSTPGFLDLSAQLAHDPAEAVDVLENAGWNTGEDGIRVKDGQRLALDVVYINSVVSNQTVLELVQQQLKEVGIDLELRPLSVADYLEAVKSPELAFSFGNFTRPELDVLSTTFGGADTNPARFADDELTELFTQLQRETDPAQRNAVGDDIQSLIVDKAYGVPVYQLAQVAATSADLHDVSFDSSSRLFLYDAWLSR